MNRKEKAVKKVLDLMRDIFCNVNVFHHDTGQLKSKVISAMEQYSKPEKNKGLQAMTEYLDVHNLELAGRVTELEKQMATIPVKIEVEGCNCGDDYNTYCSQCGWAEIKVRPGKTQCDNECCILNTG